MACYRSMIECARRTRSFPVTKPVDADKSIIDRFGAEGALLKDLCIEAVTSLGFAGFFRFNELANIQPNHIQESRGVKQMCIGRGTMGISPS